VTLTYCAGCRMSGFTPALTKMRLGDRLPIDSVLPELTATLRRSSAAVLVAPPGAGKTTRVPLVLAAEGWAQGKKIIVIEPRRIAARAAAARMAATLGESVGASVGYRVRFASRVSDETRIEVVTAGIFTRHVLEHPGLDGVAAVLFDEFHERSLDADLGLALAHDLQQGLRDDLKLLAMSATLDGARVAKILGDAPVIESTGRAFPVETLYLGRDARLPIERQVAQAVGRAVRADTGSLLVFLPGTTEIRRTEMLLRERISDPSIEIVALHGALASDMQDRAIAPAPAPRRKIVLATSIAETSLTIEGVRVVIDCGLARVPRYEPEVGLTRLETVRVSRASADQRRGRAGRIEPGVCYRLWDAPQTASLEPANRPEILAADLSGFVLDLAFWGVGDPSSLTFLDPPPPPALRQAQALLNELGALDRDGRITPAGRQLRALPLPPRLARMVLHAATSGDAATAAEIALLLSEPGLGGKDVDLGERIADLRRERSPHAHDARALAKRWAGIALSNPGQGRRDERRLPAGKEKSNLSVGSLLALAYPDRVAKSRGSGGAFLLANGRGARVDAALALARAPFLAVAEISGSAAQGRITLAAPLTPAEIEALFAERIETRDEITFDERSASLRTRRLRSLGAIVLAEQPMQVVADERSARLLAEAVARLGVERLPWTKPLWQWRDRIMFLRHTHGAEWPDLSDAVLGRNAVEWLAAAFTGKTALACLGADELAQALHALLPRSLRRRLETEAPAHFTAPSGLSVAIDYTAEEGPKIAIRVQELFGLDRHPAIGGRIPLVIELLSPAHRPVQVTRDLPRFWRGSYAAVKAEMKGRYPRHHWPDNPFTALPTTRTKRRPQ
jgi:ATP-dependent helicase HrpB